MSSTAFFFFFNDTATTEIYTLSLHDALPICAARRDARPRRGGQSQARGRAHRACVGGAVLHGADAARDRKSTRLNSSHLVISYAVFCLKKKKPNTAVTENEEDAEIGAVTDPL